MIKGVAAATVTYRSYRRSSASLKTAPMTGREQEPDYGAPKRSRRVDRLLALLIFALILLVLVRVFFR
jgi:hypothetical protein